jgi:protein SCO1/2
LTAVLRMSAMAVCLAVLLSACGGSPLAGAKGVKGGRAPQISLRDQDGRLVDLEQQRGRVVVLTFVYTHCKDICPLIASSLNAVLANLKQSEREHVRVVAVSVDPRGDTFASVRRYTRERHLLPEFRYVLGSKQDLQPVWSAYGVLIDPVNLESIDHTGRIIVIDRKGDLRAGFPPTVPAATVLADVKKLL